MNSTITGALVFACLFGAGLLGVRVRACPSRRSPELGDEGRCQGRDGIGRDDGSPGPRTIGCLNKEFVRRPEERGDADGGQDRFPRPGAGKLRF